VINILGLAIIGAIILRSVYAVVVGVRDGLGRKYIVGGGLLSNRVREGDAAIRYGWFCIIGGSLFALLGVWTLWRVLTQ
jgi:hypothetical protein